MFTTGHQRMMRRDHDDSAAARCLHLAAQLGRDAGNRRACAPHRAISHDVVVQPPLRIEYDEAQPPDVDRDRSGTTVTWQQPDVAAGCEIGDQPFLEANRIEPVRSFVSPVVVARDEDCTHARRHRVHLCLQTPARVRKLRLADFGDSVVINVVAEEHDDVALRSDRGVRRQGVERHAHFARVGRAGVADEEERRLDILRRRRFICRRPTTGRCDHKKHQHDRGEAVLFAFHSRPF